MARWAIATFGRQANRRTGAAALVSALEARGLHVGGFRQEAAPGDDAKAEVLVRIAGGDRVLLGASRAPAADGGCTFGFRDEAFEAGRRWLREDLPRSGVVVVHDVSKLELKGGGHAPAIAEAIATQAPCVVLLLASGEKLSQVLEQLGPDDDPASWVELPAPAEELDRFAAELAAAARSPG